MKTFLTLLALACTGANACAADFGNDDLVRQGRVVFDKRFTQAEQDRIKPLIVGALDQVTAFYGERRGDMPDFYFCKSVECAKHLAGAEWRSFTLSKGGLRCHDGKYWFERPSIVITSTARKNVSDERIQSTLAHELSHVEVSARAGRFDVPAWFNEGLATVVGGAKCKPGEQGIDDLAKLKVSDVWHEYTKPSAGKTNATYCQAGMEVQAWAERHGDARGVVDLLASLPKKSFESMYGPFVAPQGATQAATVAENNDH